MLFAKMLYTQNHKGKEEGSHRETHHMAKKTREILKLNVPNGLATSAEPLKPAFADHAKAHSKNVVQLSELQKQLDDL